jgi:hypothetical protein
MRVASSECHLRHGPGGAEEPDGAASPAGTSMAKLAPRGGAAEVPSSQGCRGTVGLPSSRRAVGLPGPCLYSGTGTAASEFGLLCLAPFLGLHLGCGESGAGVRFGSAVEAATARWPGAERGRSSPASWGGWRLRTAARWPDKTCMRSSRRRHGVRRRSSRRHHGTRRRSSSHGAQGA